MCAENECKDYKELDDADRSQNQVTDRAKPLRCDHKRLDENSWYRFTGAAGNAMADKCVDPGKCQTLSTGWYNGSYPKVIVHTFFVCLFFNSNILLSYLGEVMLDISEDKTNNFCNDLNTYSMTDKVTLL